MIILFCGIPGSGKTTIAKIVAERLATLGQVQLLSSDELKAPVYRKLFRALAPDEKRAEFLILDATFYKKESRRQVRALARGEKVVTVYLDCSLEVALQRNRTRQPNISERAVHIIFHQMEPPENPSLRIDTATTSAADAAGKIGEFIQDQS
jgi:adenylylsulfate kinase-like enzyme